MQGSIRDDLRPSEIDFIDLPFGDKTLDNVRDYHVYVETKTIVIDPLINEQ